MTNFGGVKTGAIVTCKTERSQDGWGGAVRGTARIIRRGGRVRNVCCSEASQAVPARSSVKGGLEAKVKLWEVKNINKDDGKWTFGSTQQRREGQDFGRIFCLVGTIMMKLWSRLECCVLAKTLKPNLGKVAWEACSATWLLVAGSAFILWPRKTTENLSGIRRLRDPKLEIDVN